MLLVGIQGSGKSNLAERHFESAGYAVASNDRCGGSRDKAIRVMQAALREGRYACNCREKADNSKIPFPYSLEAS